MKKYAYSLDQERYYGEFDSREDALVAGCDNADGGTVWTGEIRLAVDMLNGASEIILAERIVESVDLMLMDDISWEEEIVELSSDKQQELGKLVIDYLREHADWNAWGVIATQEHHPVDGPL